MKSVHVSLLQTSRNLSKSYAMVLAEIFPEKNPMTVFPD